MTIPLQITGRPHLSFTTFICTIYIVDIYTSTIDIVYIYISFFNIYISENYPRHLIQISHMLTPIPSNCHWFPSFLETNRVVWASCPHLKQCQQSFRLFCLQALHNNLVILWFCFRIRASSRLSILATLLSNFSCTFALTVVPLTLLDLDEKLSALSHSAAAAFITARIKALSLTLP